MDDENLVVKAAIEEALAAYDEKMRRPVIWPWAILVVVGGLVVWWAW